MEHDSYSKYDAEEHGGKKRTESSRSKRPSRKKTESTTTKAPIDTSDVLIIPDDVPELDVDLAKYALNLQVELLSTRKKLKKQRKMFESLLKSLTLSFCCQEISPQMIEEYVKSVSNELGEDSDEDEEAEEQLIFGKDAYKKNIAVENGVHVNLGGAAGIINPKEKAPSKGNTKQTANMIKINLSETGVEQQQPPAGKAAKSKKKSKADKSEAGTMDQAPSSPKQKRKPAAKKEKKKKTDDKQLSKEPEEADEMKTQEINKHPSNASEPLQFSHQSPTKNQTVFPQNSISQVESGLKGGFGMMVPNGIGNGDGYNYSAMFNGMNSKELEKLYQAYLPSSLSTSK